MGTLTVLSLLISEQGNHGPGSRGSWDQASCPHSPSRVFITVWTGSTVTVAPQFAPVPLQSIRDAVLSIHKSES